MGMVCCVLCRYMCVWCCMLSALCCMLITHKLAPFPCGVFHVVFPMWCFPCCPCDVLCCAQILLLGPPTSPLSSKWEQVACLSDTLKQHLVDTDWQVSSSGFVLVWLQQQQCRQDRQQQRPQP